MTAPSAFQQKTISVDVLVFITALLFSLPFNGSNLILLSATLALLVLLAVIGLSRHQHGAFKLYDPWLSLIVVLFWLWLAISIVVAPVTYLAELSFGWLGSLAIVYLLYTFLLDREAFWPGSIKLLLVIGVLLCLHAIYQYFLVHGNPVATFLNRNSLAALLNMLVFPAIGLALLTTDKCRLMVSLLIILLFVYTLAIIASRAASLGFLLGLGLLFVFTRQHSSLKRWAMLLGTLLLAVGLATLSVELNPLTGNSRLVDRVATLSNLAAAGHDRFVIWQPAWQLFLQQPLTGTGPGSYFLAITPYLHMEDYSAHHYVHNDYLQLALETGLPGVLLFLAMPALAACRFAASLPATTTSASDRIQLVTTAAALLTVFFHAFFSFIVYTLPITMLTGLYLARLNFLAERARQLPVRWHWQPAHGHRLFRRWMLGILLLAILFQLFSVGFSHYQYRAGLQQMKSNRLSEAHQAFRLAQLFTPRVDVAWCEDADLLQRTAAVLTDRQTQRLSLLKEARNKALRALALNPLRARNHFVLGRIQEQLAPGASVEVVAHYRESLRRDPRFLPARLALARKLIELGRQEDALAVVNSGLALPYSHLNRTFFDYLGLAVSLNRQVGERDLSRQLAERLVYFKTLGRQDGAGFRPLPAPVP